MRDTYDDRDILYLAYINVNFFCVKYYSFVRCYVWRKLGKLYMRSLFLTAACEQWSQNKKFNLKKKKKNTDSQSKRSIPFANFFSPCNYFKRSHGPWIFLFSSYHSLARPFLRVVFAVKIPLRDEVMSLSRTKNRCIYLLPAIKEVDSPSSSCPQSPCQPTECVASIWVSLCVTPAEAGK